MATSIPMNTLEKINYKDKGELNEFNVDGCAWRKPYTVTIPTKPTGVSELYVRRTGTESNCGQLAAVPCVADGKVLYGDTVAIRATATEGYNSPTTAFTGGVTSNKVTGNVTLSVTAGSVKSFTLAISTITGVASQVVMRTISPLAGAPINAGALTNGATIYYGDVLTITATATTGYGDPYVTSPVTVTGAIDTSTYVKANSLKNYTITFTKPTYGTWTSSTLTLPHGTTWEYVNKTVTFTKPDGSTVTNTVTADSPTVRTLSFGTASYGSWNDTSSVSVYDYTYNVPQINGGTTTGTITAAKTFTATVDRYNATFTNTLAGTSGTNSTTSGTHIWTISGTNTAGTAFSRTFTTTAHGAQYYYVISRSSTATQATSNITFTPTVTRSTHTYKITITNPSYGTVKNGTTAISSGATVNYGTSLTITPTSATGYTTTASSSTGTISNNTLTVNGAETITFTRTANTYYVYYEQGNATSGTLPNDQSRTYPNAVTLSTNNMAKANTTANSYTVTYANGTATSGTLPSTQTSKNTTTYTKNGWTTSSDAYNDLDYANGASFGSNSTTNLTLYPNFTTSTTNGGVTVGTNSMAKSNTTANSYTVTYNQGNASSTTNKPSTQTSVNTTSYTANGWTTTSGSTTRSYANGAATGALTANKTLYPCFSQTTTNGGVTLSSNTMSKNNSTANGYKVTYKQGTATSTTVPSAQTATNTTTYTHSGWATTQNGTKAYNKGASTGALSANMTLYPYFDSSLSYGSVTLATNSMTKNNTTDSSYTVTMDRNDGSSTTPETLTATKTRSYTANGWTTTSGSTTRNYTNGQSVQLTSALDVYPCFTQSTSGGSVTLPTLTRTGYAFEFWSTKPLELSLTNPLGKVTSPYTPTANTTLYAQWQANTYYVYYKQGTASSTTNLPSTQSRTYPSGVTLATNSMTKNNTTDYSYTVTYNYNGSGAANTTATATKTRSYTANGWTTTSGSTTQNYANGASFGSSSTTNLTLYPCFKQSTSGGSVTLPLPDVWTGHNFKGWATSSTATSGVTGDYTPTGNVTLYAIWNVKSYILTISTITGVASQKVTRTSSPLQGATTGLLANGATIYYGDVLTITATADSGYDTPTVTSPITVTENIATSKYVKAKLGAPVINSVECWDFKYANFNITNPNSVSVNVKTYLECDGCGPDDCMSGYYTTQTIPANTTKTLTYTFTRQMCEANLNYQISFEQTGYTSSSVVSGVEEYDYIRCSITWNLTNCTVSNQPTYIECGDSLDLTITPSTGYKLPTTITVSTYVEYDWNPNNSSNQLSLSYATDAITITIAAEAITSLTAPVISGDLWEYDEDGDYIGFKVRNNNSTDVRFHYTIKDSSGNTVDYTGSTGIAVGSNNPAWVYTDYMTGYGNMTMTCYFTINNVTSPTTTYILGKQLVAPVINTAALPGQGSDYINTNVTNNNLVAVTARYDMEDDYGDYLASESHTINPESSLSKQIVSETATSLVGGKLTVTFSATNKTSSTASKVF